MGRPPRRGRRGAAPARDRLTRSVASAIRPESMGDAKIGVAGTARRRPASNSHETSADRVHRPRRAASRPAAAPTIRTSRPGPTDSRPTPSTLATATDPTDPPDPTDPTTRPIRPIRPIRSSRRPATMVASASPGCRSSATARRCSLHADRSPRAGHRVGSRRRLLLRPRRRRDMARGRGLGRRWTASTCRGASGGGCRSPRTSRYSGTNTQEVGVDEGDIVETDGELRVRRQSATGCASSRVADAEVVGDARAPRAAATSCCSTATACSSPRQGLRPAGDTIVSLFDVTDPTNADAAAPLAPRRFGSSPLAAVDGIARLVLIDVARPARLPFVQPTSSGSTRSARSSATSRSSTSRRSRTGCRAGSTRPATARSARWQPILDCNTSPPRDDFAGLGLTWIASVDLLGDATPVGSAGIVSTGDTVYASHDNLYIATQIWDWQFGPIQRRATSAPTTRRTRRPADADPPVHARRGARPRTYVASGEVPGRLLNQFAMSEHNGDLRVATTTEGWNFGEQSESAVYVLRAERRDARQRSRRSAGSATTEQIYAVRFLGDTAYVVTFRQTDPLYVIDLTDPANPVLDGRAEDPRLLGLPASGRRRAAARRRPGRHRRRPDARHAAVSLFDVSDPANPQRSTRWRSADRARSSGTTRRSSTGPRTARSCCRCRPAGTTAVRRSTCLADGDHRIRRRR